LIRQGAKLVETARDVLEELRMPTEVQPLAKATAHQKGHQNGGANADGRSPAAQQRLNVPDEPETPLLQALGYDPVGLDALQARTGLSTAMLQVQLLELELEGAVARLPGGLFQRLARA
ncbi:MAG: DNA-protecting protein DprA, partial [Simplicispira sp.]|nr:DNA-protecting protein DprA [Simplicispira sp.]